MHKAAASKIALALISVFLLTAGYFPPTHHAAGDPQLDSGNLSNAYLLQQSGWEEILRQAYQNLGWSDFQIAASTAHAVITSRPKDDSGTVINLGVGDISLIHEAFEKSPIDFHGLPATITVMTDRDQNVIGHTMEWQLNGLYYIAGMATEKIGGYNGSVDELLVYAEALFAAATGSASSAPDLCSGVICGADYCGLDGSTLYFDCTCDSQDGQCYCFTKTCDAGCDPQLGACRDAIQPDLCENLSCPPSCEENTSLTDGACDPDSSVCLYTSATDCGLAGCDQATGLCKSLTDLSIKQVKVLQAVEGGRLIASKPTLAAVELAWLNDQQPADVNVSLFIDGVGYAAQRFSVKSSYSQSERLRNQHLVLFHLPQGMLTGGQHQFQVEAVIANADIVDPDLSNNAQLITSTFSNSRSLALLFAAHPSISEAAVWRYYHTARQLLLDVFPVENISIAPVIYQLDASQSAKNQVAELESLREIYNSESGQYASFAVGLFPDDFFGVDTYGMSYWWARRSVLIGDGSTNSHAHHVLPHELAHELFGDEYGGWLEYSTGKYLPSGTWIYHGQRRELEIISSGTSYINFMGLAGGGDNVWVDQQTWNTLAGRFAFDQSGAPGFKALASLLPVQTDAAGGFLVGGTINKDGTVEVDRLLALDAVEVEHAFQSGYWLIAVGADGQEIARQPIEIDLAFEDSSPFLAAIKVEGSTIRTLRIQKDEQTLWEKSPSPTPPVVSLQPIAADAPLSGVINVEWQASDADGDALSYSLHYSADDGSTWVPVANGITEREYSLDLDRLPGSASCRLRVIVSDGWHSMTADSTSTFAVMDKPAVVEISEPLTGQHFEPGSSILFSAFAYDTESGWIAGDQITWSSDRDGRMGSGNYFNLSTLSPGAHVITASIPANASQPVQASVSITVGEEEPEGENVDLTGLYISAAVFSLFAAVAAVVLMMVMKRRQKKPAVIIAIILLVFAVLCLLFSLVLIWGGSYTAPAEPGTSINAEEGLPVPAAPSLPVVTVQQEPPVEEDPDPSAEQTALPESPAGNAFDDFSEQHGWTELDENRFSAGRTEGGIYRIDFWQAGDTEPLIVTHPLDYGADLSDVSVSVQAAGMDADGAYGLVCRVYGQDLYGFHIANDERYWLYKSVDGSTVTLDRGSDDGILDDMNLIEMRCVGTQITALVNGNQVSQITDPDLHSGSAGLFAQPFGGEIQGAWSFFAVFDNYQLAPVENSSE